MKHLHKKVVYIWKREFTRGQRKKTHVTLEPFQVNFDTQKSSFTEISF